HEVGVGLHGRRVREAGDPSGSVCVIAIGKMLEVATKAADQLAERGADVTVWDARCCAPLDPEMLADAARHRRVITVEDGVRDGGIGMTAAAEIATIDTSVPVEVLGLPTTFLPHDPKPGNIHARYGLDAESLAERALG
ncbi:MAG: transketolase C-terminal domain-containing protein, partial [Actinomycetota bacterium]